MPKRPLRDADFTQRRAMNLPEAARYDVILNQHKDGSLGHPDGKQQRGNHGWDDIKDTPTGTTIEQTVADDILANGPTKKVRRYEAPFTLANRETDYRIAWGFFAQPAGKAMNVAVQNGRPS